MIKWKVWAAAAALMLSASDPAQAQGFFRVEDLKAGMTGTGKTCYQGSKPEEFQVEIIGVIRGIGPGADAVLARLSGGPLEQAGVFEGMSGSPVFIEGRLLGAVAFSFPFAKEPIAGITPIEQMVEAFEEGPLSPTQGPRVILKLSRLWDYRLQLPDAGKAPGFRPNPLEAGLHPALMPLGGHTLRPIATPLSFGGFHAMTLHQFGPQLRSMGFALLQGSGSVSLQARKASSGRPEEAGEPLEPGSNIVIPLIRGDLEVSAGGTVTHIEGDRVYAFGHPLFNLGFSELPMHKGRALTIFPSLQSSFKILEATEPVGAMLQDRGQGIYGLLGKKAKMIPAHVQMTTSRGQKKTFRYEIVNDRFLTPFIVNLALFNTIIGSERGLGVSTLQVKGKIRVKGESPVQLESRFSSDSNSPVFASLSVALPISFLLSSGFDNLDIEGIDLEIQALEDDRSALLDALRLDRSELRAGEALNVQIVSKKANGETVEDSFPIRIPPDVTPGPLQILIADGMTVMEMDAREQGDELIPRDLTQLIRFINNIRKNDRLYVRMFRRDPGAVVRGEGMPGLPPSILSILDSERNTGSMTPIRTLPLMEYELPPSDYVIAGSKLFSLLVKP